MAVLASTMTYVALFYTLMLLSALNGAVLSSVSRFQRGAINSLPLHSFLAFRPSDQGKETTIARVIWVTNGLNRCQVGYLPAKYIGLKERLNGRIAQVVEIFSFSSNNHKLNYSACYQGVCQVVLIDFNRDDDGILNDMLSDVESVEE